MSKVTPENAATPFEAATAVVPDKVPGPLAIVNDTTAVAEVITLLLASLMATAGCVVNASPPLAPAGCVLKSTAAGLGGLPDAAGAGTAGSVTVKHGPDVGYLVVVTEFRLSTVVLIFAFPEFRLVLYDDSTA